jgi:hypothetical protein
VDLRIGAAALAALVLMAVGLLLYGVADLRFGAYIAVGGLCIALGAILAAEAWASTHDDDFG